LTQTEVVDELTPNLSRYAKRVTGSITLVAYVPILKSRNGLAQRRWKTTVRKVAKLVTSEMLEVDAEERVAAPEGTVVDGDPGRTTND
jgi:hypothetical protein